MKMVTMRVIEGPNVYVDRPVIVMRIDLMAFTERDSDEYPGFVERLLALCPGLYDHHCAMKRPGGFVERLYGGTYFGHIIEHVALELQTVLGYTTNFGKTRNAGEPSLYDIVMEYGCEEVGQFALLTAMELVQACVFDTPFALEEKLEEGKRIAAKYDLGPSTRALVEEAQRRHIPVRRIARASSLVQLGTGKYRRFFEATVGPATSAIAVDIASDKVLTKRLLSDAGIAVPEGSVVYDVREALQVYSSLQKPVVVKPRDSCQGNGVTMGVQTPEQLAKAFGVAQRFSQAVLVEQIVNGQQYRLMVIDGQVVAASQRLPAHVIGDGVHTIEELVSMINLDPLRGDGHEKPLTKIRLDETAKLFLQEKNRTIYDVAKRDEYIWLRDSANLSTGGIAIDVTQQVHDGFLRVAKRVATTIGLDICGIDLIAQDIAQFEMDKWVVLEVNAAPGIRMHHYPSVGQTRNVAKALLNHAFAPGVQARVPIIAITGTNGKTTTTRMIGYLLGQAGYCVGMTTTEGITIGHEQVMVGDTTGPQSARLVLADPTVEIAVLETARGGILRGGLGYDFADIGIITNLSDDHLGQDGLASKEDILHTKSLVVERLLEHGIAIINAQDEALLRLSTKLSHPVVLTSLEEDLPALQEHIKHGHRAYVLIDGMIIEFFEGKKYPILRVDHLAITWFGHARFHIANVMQAIAATRHLGLSREQIATYVSGFVPRLQNRGRLMIYRLPCGRYVVADYGHNTHGIEAIGTMMSRLLGRKIPAVIGFPGDRADQILIEAAQEATRFFAPIYVKEDVDKRGRQPGAMLSLLVKAIQEIEPTIHVVAMENERVALSQAIRECVTAPVILVFYEVLSPVETLMQELQAQAVDVHDFFQEQAKKTKVVNASILV